MLYTWYPSVSTMYTIPLCPHVNYVLYIFAQQRIKLYLYDKVNLEDFFHLRRFLWGFPSAAWIILQMCIVQELNLRRREWSNWIAVENPPAPLSTLRNEDGHWKISPNHGHAETGRCWRANNANFVQSEQYSPDSRCASYGRVPSMRVIICGLCGSHRSTQASTLQCTALNTMRGKPNHKVKFRRRQGVQCVRVVSWQRMKGKMKNFCLQSSSWTSSKGLSRVFFA